MDSDDNINQQIILQSTDLFALNHEVDQRIFD